MKKPARPKRTRLRAAAKTPVRKRPSLSRDQREQLEADIGYTFSDETWLTRALTHPSLIDDFGGGAQFSNQRLEFLGDRVLGLVVAEMLMTRYPKEREGYLTKLFHTLVSGETCAAVGEKFNLRDYLFLDASMRRNRSGNYDKAVADAVESLIAAIYRDSGLKAAEAFIKRCWIFDTIKASPDKDENPKTRLSDWCGAQGVQYAEYKTIAQDGPPHAPIFTVKVSVESCGHATATGSNKQEAEKAAAAALLEQLDTK